MMSIVIMFMLPIGIATFIFDKKNYIESLEVFHNYIKTIKASRLTDVEKIDSINMMFYHNNYKIVQKEVGYLCVEKKHFNLGLLFIMFGLLNVLGILFYLGFYRYFLKARKITVSLGNEAISS